MTLVNIDLRNQGYETGPDDRVVFYSLLVREGDFGTISTAPVEVKLTDGQATIDLAPGPVGVQIIAGQIVDTRVKIGEVPPSGPTTLNAVMMVTPAYTPALQAAMIAAIERAKELALTKVDSEVAKAVSGEVGEFKTKAEQALAKSTLADFKSDTALSKSTTAESFAGNAVSRVEALEVMGGLAPGEPVDGQTANLVLQDGTLTRAAVDSTISQATGLFPVNFYGAMGDGVTDDAGAIQAAIDAAYANGGGTVFLPAATYNLLGRTPIPGSTATNFSTYALRIPDNVSLVGQEGATLIEDIGYSNSRITILLSGSNISVENIRIRNNYDQSKGSRPTSIMLGIGDDYDPNCPSMENVTIRNVRFERAWYNLKVAFKAGGDSTLKGLRVIDCVGIHETESPPGGSSKASGGFNIACTPAGRIVDASVINCRDYNPWNAACIGMSGVNGGIISGCHVFGSGPDGAGIQLENGTRRVTITGNVVTDNVNGIWVDDSEMVSISSNQISNPTSMDSRIGIRITRQGWSANPSPTVGTISAMGNVLENAYIRADTFSTPYGSPLFTSVSLSANLIYLDGVGCRFGIMLSQFLSASISGNQIFGASESSIHIIPREGALYSISGNITNSVSGEASSGLTFSSANGYRPVVSDNQFRQQASPISIPTSGVVGAGARIFTGDTEPNGAVSAPRGSLYLCTSGSGSALWIKETASGFTGWKAV